MIWLSAWVEATGHFHKISKESPQLFELHFYAAHVQELCELTWQKLNSPGEFSNINLERSHQLIDLIENFNTDVYFAPIEGLTLKRASIPLPERSDFFGPPIDLSFGCVPSFEGDHGLQRKPYSAVDRRAVREGMYRQHHT